MNVLSLFDGMSCGQIALRQLDIIPEIYYASEIDKYAIQQTQQNFPNTIQLGSVVDIEVSKLEHIDLLIGGSPCQSFSFAGKRNGMTTTENEEIYTLDRYLELKAEGFEFEGQSYLFWEYMRILTDIRKYNPNVLFLLENVEMGAKWKRILSEAIGIFGVHINSALVSAQNRKRIYWTNIKTRQEGLFGELHSDIPQPKDRGILLKDILDKDVDEKYYLSDKMINCLMNRQKTETYTPCKFNPFEEPFEKKTRTLNASMFMMADGDNYILDNKNKDNLIMQINPSVESGGKQPYQQNSIYDINGISPALNAQLSTGSNMIVVPETEIKSGTLRTHKDGNGFREVQSGKGACVPARAREDGSGQNVAIIGNRIRRLTPTECARLQTIPDLYKWTVSDSQQYKMLGNGWTVEVIKHIFSFIH
jgi:DNA (cytosine-5)-methyltransferase 3A